jgi:molybdopterin-containing oxidoreductase family iron-sulfur binding subunit
VSKAEGKAFMVHTDGSPRQLGRGIMQTLTPEQFAKGEKPETGEHGGEHARPINFYPPRADTPGYYQPYRWSMVVDTDRCTGCSACVAACYAENNIPVVGKERVALGREMSWLRIERFYEGEGDSYRTLLQPMLCQHCENAGCEPVCPVYATYHTPDGLNAQVYNRCVGTRYCSNNCAYKVRRFNWFDYTWDEPLHLQLNPDVTVRSKGVMEKCTFCVQRIHRARFAANAEGRDIREGDVTPACVQTCPTKALTFGNLADPNSEVARKAARDEKGMETRVRQYEVFPELANKPAITYLRRVASGPSEEA